MRGSISDKKEFYSWWKFDKDCIELAAKINADVVPISSVYGVPRGGIAVAVRLANLLRLPLVSTPDFLTLIVDDIVDSGNTRDKYGMYPFASLYVKPWAKVRPSYYIHETENWIIFSWEQEANESENQGQGFI